MRPRPRLTVRARLTVTYGVLFLAAGLVLLGVSHYLVDDALRTRPDAQQRADREAFLEEAGIDPVELLGALPPVNFEDGVFNDAIENLARRGREDALDELLVQGSLALAVITVLAFGAGWVVAGRVLRPLRDITAMARTAADHKLDQRIELTGPHDEIRELADTFNTMLARLSVAFESHRRFAADASHELRTPLAGMRAQADVVLADPSSSSDATALADQVVAGSVRSERLIDGLLALARSEADLHDLMPIDLAELVGDIVDARLEQAAAAGVTVELELHDARIEGDPVLIERLIDNLIANAIDHNHHGGEVDVSVVADSTPTVVVTNTGRSLPDSELTDIRRPFRRGRARTGTGHGLGLTIVSAVAVAHGANLTIEPGPAGGLTVTISFVR